MKKKYNYAVFFDFDGTLADTMEDNFLAWKEAFKDSGVSLKREDYFPLEGLHLKEIVQSVEEKYNIKVNIDKMVEKKEEVYKSIQDFNLYHGVTDLIDKLKANKVFIAIVSASLKERLFSTAPLEFLEKFDLIITSDNFEKFKPHPDPYLLALKESGLEKDNCLVVENSPLGIKSAKSAGLYCIALTSTLEKSFLNEADEIIKNFYSLKDSPKFLNLLK